MPRPVVNTDLLKDNMSRPRRMVHDQRSMVDGPEPQRSAACIATGFQRRGESHIVVYGVSRHRHNDRTVWIMSSVISLTGGYR